MPAKDGKIGGYPIQLLLNVARETVVKKTSGSSFLDPESEEAMPKFDRSELTQGRVLGRGGFCVVNDVSKITLAGSNGGSSTTFRVTNTDENYLHNVVQNREFMAAWCLRGEKKDPRYAMKTIQESSYKDTDTFINAVVDLAIEARFLAVIRHPNIIKMRATSSGSPYSDQYFIVLDRLFDTLTQRMPKWKKQLPSGMVKRAMARRGKNTPALWVERCVVIYDLSRGLDFLHSMNVMYRDIKPDNIGFDVRGDVKIFDLGLAKEVDPDTRDKNGTYSITGETGSPRYMAPEVALSKPYNETCDVYSLAILAWQILQLATPFEKYTAKMFQERVIRKGVRPACDSKWPKEISDILRLGWGELSKRPTMEVFGRKFLDEVNKYSEEQVSGTFNTSRKSEISLHRELGGVDA